MHLGLRTLTIGGLAAAALAVSIAGADAKIYKLTAGSSHPPVVPWVETITKHVVPQSNVRLKAMGSPNSIQWTEAYAGALYNFKNTLEGIEDGLADLGWVGTLWEPVKMPLANVSYYAPFAEGDVMKLLSIAQEMQSLPAVKAEWDRRNQINLGPMVADTYHLVSKFPITSISQLRGKKVLAPGPTANWLKGLGATPVNVGLPIYYNSLKTGVADIGIIITMGMLPFKLHEVAPYIVKVDMGGCICGGMTINKDSWNKLPLHMKAVFQDLGRDYSRIQTATVAKKSNLFLKIMAKQAATIMEFPAAERKKWVNALPDIAGDWAKANGAAGQQVLKVFMDGVRKRGGKPARDWDKGM